jgi:dynactin-6
MNNLGLTCASQHCILSPKSVIQPGEVVPDFTVIYSNGMRRLDKRGVTDLKNKAQAWQIEVLRKLIPSNPAKFQS